MSELRCKRIAETLTELMTQHGWDGYVYSFTIGIEWTEPNSVYLREASPSVTGFLADYKKRRIHHSHHRLFVTRSDLPQTFVVAEFPDLPLDRALAELMTDHGWRSGLIFPLYGYGGALGLTTFVSRAAIANPAAVEDTIANMFQCQSRINAWAREVVDQHQVAHGLSPREAECMLRVSEGQTSRMIADAIGIAPRTVEFHVQNAMHKLGGASRSQAASKLVQLSLPGGIGSPVRGSK